jgi:ribosomal protein S18 acetylase RimI-like enzyme
MTSFSSEAQKISLRPASTADEPLLFQLYASTRSEEFALVPWSEAQLEAFLKMQFSAQNRSYMVQYPAADHLIILSGEQAIGRLLVNRAEDEIHLVDINLLPDFRGGGIGGSLIKELQSEAARDGKSFRLHVFHSNPARRLYQRLGFSEVGEASMYFEMLWQPLK